jgi:hypothetical protein
MRTARHILAALAVLSLLAPLAHSLFVAAHVLHETSQNSPGHALDHSDDFEVSLHGHTHDHASPSHSHSWIGPQAATRLNQAAAFQGADPAATFTATAALRLGLNDSPLRGPGSRLSRDRHPPSLFSTILRI